MTLTDPRARAHPRPEPAGGELPAMVTESGLARFRAWLAHAPAERAPLPLIPAIWTATEIMHAAGVHGLYVGGAVGAATGVAGWIGERRSKDAEHPRLAGTEVAAVTGATGAWVTAGTVLGPAGGPGSPAERPVPRRLRRGVLVAAQARGGPRRPAAPR